MSNYDPALVGAVTDKGLYRSENEDAYWQPDPTTPTHLGALYLVADGVGGQEYGGIAARIVTAVLSEAFYRGREQGKEIPEALRFGITQANQAVFDEAQASGVRMGATVVTAVHHQGQLFIAHVGDSRAYQLHERALTPLTRDDSFVQQQLDAGVITEAEAAQHQFRNLVTQVLGNKLEIDIHLAEPSPFVAGDVLLLCSDGLSGVVAESSMTEILAANPAAKAAASLVAAAKAADSQDNITAVVVHQSAQQTPLVPTPPAVAKPAREWNVWLWLGMVAFLIAISVMLWWWRGQQTPVESAAETDATATIVVETTPLPPTAEIRETAVALDAAVIIPSRTAEAATPEPAEPTLSVTASSEAEMTPEATPVVTGCVSLNAYAYVWAKADLQADTCVSAIADVYLNPGEPVLILQPTPQRLRASGGCLEADFIEIQSQTDETIRGWVLDSDIDREDACP